MRFAPFSPSSISAPYRKVTILYPSNIESTQLPSKPQFYMAEPHISTFRVFAPYRIVTHLYPSNIGPAAPKFSDPPFSENSSNSIGRWHNFPKVVLAELWCNGNVLNQKQNRHCHMGVSILIARPRNFGKFLTRRTLQNEFFNQVVRILCHTIGFVSKNPAQRANQISKSSSDDPFQAIFHFFIDFSRRKIDHFSRV